MTEQLPKEKRLKAVTLSIRWPELFSKDMPELIRRNRWATWLRKCRKSKRREIAHEWVRGNDCANCAHRRGCGWCSLQALPCSVNPILTMRHGMPGMACMGSGRELRVPEQIDIFEALA